MINTHEKDETGHPICKSLGQMEVWRLAMQGLPAELWSFDPHVVMFVSGFFTTAAMFKAIRWHGHKVVFLATESPYQEDEQLMRAEFADLTLLNDPCNLERYRELGPAEYMPHAYRPVVHHPRTGPLDPDLSSDFCFIGTAFESRIKFFEALDLDGIDLLLAGNDWGRKLPLTSPVAKFVATGAGDEMDSIANDETAELYRNAKVGLNIYRREGESTHEHDIGVAMGPREVEMAACGLPFVRDPRAEGDEVLHMLPRFHSPAEASEQLHWLLSHDRERKLLAAAAREAIAPRTFENNAKRMLALLENL
jgi:spore maturation protein CgeB